VFPTAAVTMSGEVQEVNDSRGRALLEQHAVLVDFARALLKSPFDSVRFVWRDPTGRFRALRIRAAPPAPGGDATALVEEFPVPCALTARELDVVTLLAGGRSNPEIAAYLGCSPRTVETHVVRILQKLDQTTRAGAAAVAVELGLLRLPVAGGGRAVEGLAVGAIDELTGGRRLREAAFRPQRVRSQPRPFLIGSAFPLSGAASSDGIEMRNGSALAVQQINARGGIAGRPVEQLVVDMDVDSAEGARSALRRLVEAEVDGITTGYVFSHDFARYGDVVEAGIPLLNTMTLESDAELMRAEHVAPHVFQVGPTEVQYVPAFVRFLEAASASGAWQPANRRVALVGSPASSAQLVGQQATLDHLERSGWTVDSLLNVTRREFDWDDVLGELRRREPAAVMLAEFIPGEAAAFQRRFAEAPIDTLIFGLYAPSMPEYLALAGPAAEGVVWATVTGLYSDWLAAAFADQYRRAYGLSPGRCQAGLSYDQVHLLASAWARAGNPRAFARVVEELRRVPHRGVNGTYFLGHARQCGLSYPDETPDPSLGQANLIFQIQNGEHRILQPAPYADSSFRVPSWFGATLAAR
jgi:branched-chain amino acid transport system substrate-binding protein